MATAPSPKPLSSALLLPVFLPAVIIIVLLIIGTISNPDFAASAFKTALNTLSTNFGWFYMLAVAFFLVFIVILAVSPWGRIKLGPDHAEPQYSFPAWFAMLFSAGYGIALVFFGVAEPVTHYAAPPQGSAETIEAAKQAMQIAFFHWGFHIWGIYGLTGLVLAYFAFRHGLPLSMRSALYPIIGDKIYGPIGHGVDVIAILGTLFGIATTLGLSVAQINAGLHYLWPNLVPVSPTVQVSLIVIITALTTLSVVAGMDKGIKRLSILNIVLAGALMCFVFIVGPSINILETFLQNTGSYLNNIIERTFNLQAYSHSDWLGEWTLFIFSWTIAWAPFVGLFIAKISRGRSIRQFVFGVLLVPSLFSFLWFSVFGDTALHLIMEEGYNALINDAQKHIEIALFKVYEHLPFTSLLSIITVFLIMTFFVTSSDSGALVIDALASGGREKTPIWQRVFWASMGGLVASVLLLAGGLKALQAMSTTSALPFAIVMILAAIGMWRALIIEGLREESLQAHMQSSSNPNRSWKQRLKDMIDYAKFTDVADFIRHTVYPAMKRVEKVIDGHHWPINVVYDEEYHRAFLEITLDDQMDFIYDIRMCAYNRPSFAYANSSNQQQDDEDMYYRAEVFLRRGGQHYNVYGFDEEEIIEDILLHLEKYLHFLHISPGILPWNMQEHDEMLNGETQLEPDESDKV